MNGPLPIRKSVKDGDHHQRYLCHQEYCYDYYQHKSGSSGVFLQVNFRYQRAPARFTGKLIRNDNKETIFTLQWSLCCCIENFVISEDSSLSSYFHACSLDSQSCNTLIIGNAVLVDIKVSGCMYHFWMTYLWSTLSLTYVKTLSLTSFSTISTVFWRILKLSILYYRFVTEN